MIYIKFQTLHPKVIHTFAHVLLLFCLLIKKPFLAAVFEFVYTALSTKDKNIPVDNELPCKMNLLYRY